MVARGGIFLSMIENALIEIWKAAAEQVFYSLGIDAGPIISMAAFSRYRNNIYRDAILLVVMSLLHRPYLELLDLLQRFVDQRALWYRRLLLYRFLGGSARQTGGHNPQ